MSYSVNKSVLIVILSSFTKRRINAFDVKFVTNRLFSDVIWLDISTFIEEPNLIDAHNVVKDTLDTVILLPIKGFTIKKSHLRVLTVLKAFANEVNHFLSHSLFAQSYQ